MRSVREVKGEENLRCSYKLLETDLAQGREASSCLRGPGPAAGTDTAGCQEKGGRERAPSHLSKSLEAKAEKITRSFSRTEKGHTTAHIPTVPQGACRHQILLCALLVLREGSALHRPGYFSPRVSPNNRFSIMGEPENGLLQNEFDRDEDVLVQYVL